MNIYRYFGKYFAFICALAGACMTGMPSYAQNYPNKAVRVIVPYSPGSNPDVMTRLVTRHLAERLGQPFVIDTKIGAGGSIGMGVGAKAEPDGYAIIVGHVAGLAINPNVYTKLPYDVAKDFVPIAQIYKSPLLLVVSESSPYKTLPDLIAAAKASPGKLTFSSGGNGTGAHLSGEYLGVLSGASFLHIPFKTSSDAMVSVVSGDSTLNFINQSAAWPLVKSKKLRVLAISGDARLPEYPDLPTVGETLKGFDYYDWAGLLAPAGTPAATVLKLQREISAVLALPDVVQQMRGQGFLPVQGTSEEFGKFIKNEQQKWGQVAKRINLKLD
ncbi:Bug family tripartite tricarboxylate transporter substrate binding protein [Polaromonas glacialis]|uniref:Bug family tripartite tricarboxylate transporter substrate binding protein n=1 Tax=Polaromonas glacialis TaxID=866564 RepID=UPI000AD844FD|nr:tripartite tricarboxylate transporter substrate binding protein [Polaromonas glacialis]